MGNWIDILELEGEKKTTGRLRLMLMNGGHYKALSEDWLNQFRSNLGY